MRGEGPRRWKNAAPNFQRIPMKRKVSLFCFRIKRAFVLCVEQEKYLPLKKKKGISPSLLPVEKRASVFLSTKEDERRRKKIGHNFLGVRFRLPNRTFPFSICVGKERAIGACFIIRLTVGGRWRNRRPGDPPPPPGPSQVSLCCFILFSDMQRLVLSKSKHHCLHFCVIAFVYLMALASACWLRLGVLGAVTIRMPSELRFD